MSVLCHGFVTLGINGLKPERQRQVMEEVWSAMPPVCSLPAQEWRLKTRDWKTRHQTAGVENAGVAQYGKPKSPLFNIVTSVLQQPLELM